MFEDIISDNYVIFNAAWQFGYIVVNVFHPFSPTARFHTRTNASFILKGLKEVTSSNTNLAREIDELR